jgi:serine/threonine protein phosphatase PrpC
MAYNVTDAESLGDILIHNGVAKLATLHSLRDLQGQSREQVSEAVQKDLFFLGKALIYMTTGQSRPQAVVSPFQDMFNNTCGKQYGTARDMVEELKEIQTGRREIAQVSFTVGQATHAGKVRPANEDSAFVMPMMRLQESQALATALCVVADGMGGHEAGERASKVAYKKIAEVINAELIMPALQGEVTRKLHGSSGDVLREAVVVANQRVYELAQQTRSNMGTTVTAALLEGPTAYIVNVGDSRTYRLRNGVLEKLTVDHSLVASLLQAGAISEEEVYTHPQRSQIYRSLGTDAKVEVDLFTTDLQKGDRLLLCSDGLWEMVRDPQILDILLRYPEPQAACDVLVQAAYDAGGEDNITVVVVKVD